MIFYGLRSDQYRKEVNARKYVLTKEQRSLGENWMHGQLREIFPHTSILEQFPCFGTRLKLDFLILTAAYRLAFEFDGEQHSKYVPHFHKNKMGWAAQQLRDVRKTKWCEVNSIQMIRMTTINDELLREMIREQTK